MKKKDKYCVYAKLYNLIIKILPFILITFSVTSIFFLTDIKRNWTTYADQELTISYNALLINSNIYQQYLDHPGFFTIQLSRLVLNFLYYFNFIDFNNANEIGSNKPIYQYFKILVFNSRVTTAISLILLHIIFYIALTKLFIYKTESYIATVLIFLSSSIISHTIQLRTELISFLLLFLSLVYYNKSFASKDKKKLFYLCLSMLLLIFASINKIQILAISIFFHLHIYIYNKLFNINDFKIELKDFLINYFYSKYKIIITIFFIILPVNFYFQMAYVGYTSYISFILNCTYYFVYSILFMHSFRKSCVGFSYFFFIFFTAYAIGLSIVSLIDSNDINAIWKVYSNPQYLFRYTSEKANYLADAGLQYNASNLIFFLAFIIRPIKYNLVDWQFNTQLLYLSILFIIYCYNFYYKEVKVKLFILFSIFLYFIVLYINNIRYSTQYYIIFQEYFLLSSVFLVISRHSRSVRAKFLILILIPMLFLNGDRLISFLNKNDLKVNSMICSSWILNDFKTINYEKLLNECKYSDLLE